jgi:hypothetical protein
MEVAVAVAEHDIKAPRTDKLDDTGVDTATKKCHGATCTTRASGNIVGIETKLGSAQNSCGGTNRLGGQSGRNNAPCSGCGVSDGAQGGIGRNALEAEVADSVDNTNHGVGIEVAGPVVADNFATDTIFICTCECESESDKGDTAEVSEVIRERIKATVANEELHVAEPKRVALTGAAIFARAKEPKERHVA